MKQTIKTGRMPDGSPMRMVHDPSKKMPYTVQIDFTEGGKFKTVYRTTERGWADQVWGSWKASGFRPLGWGGWIASGHGSRA